MSARPAKRQLVEPTYWTSPHGIRARPEPALTYGPEVADLCDKAGYTPDPQQELGLDLVFAIRSDGSPAAFSGCVICARQNLKSGLFLQCCIGWMFVLDDVSEIAWSAHELRTSLNSQTELFSILESPALSKYLLPARTNGVSPSLVTAHGQERVELTTGQKVWFQTRTRDGGRGLGKPKLILDEAFKLKSRMVGALLPILLAQWHPQMLAGSSAPPLDPDAAVLRDIMDRGRHHKSPELWYLEWLAKREACADPDCLHPKDAQARGLDCALDREHLIRQANPTLTTGRITLRTVRNLRQELPPEEFMRECMGWPDNRDAAAGPPAINARRWSSDALRKPKAAAPVKACVVLDTEPDRSVTSIGVAGLNRDGQLVVVEHTESGESWVVDRLRKLRKSIEVLEVALHPSTEAKTLIPAIKAARLDPDDPDSGPLVEELTKLTSNDQSGGCSSLITKVTSGDVVHVGQPELDAAVTVARTRLVNGAQRWVREDMPVPIAPLGAASTALYRFELLNAAVPKAPPPPPRRVRQTAGREVDRVGF